MQKLVSEVLIDEYVLFREPDPQRIIDIAVRSAKDDLYRRVGWLMGEQPYTVKYEVQFRQRIDDISPYRKVVVTAYITPATEKDLISGVVMWDLGSPLDYKGQQIASRAKHSCIWCHGSTYDDDRGNCSACGGPRYGYR